MKLFIPEIGTTLQLAAPWTFSLHCESRNSSLFPLVGFTDEDLRLIYTVNPPKSLTLPAGTVLTVDRIYIRKGLGEFSSLSFNLVSWPKDAPLPENSRSAIKGKKPRFWAKLEDCNNIEFAETRTDIELAWWEGLKDQLDKSNGAFVPLRSAPHVTLKGKNWQVRSLTLAEAGNLPVNSIILIKDGIRFDIRKVSNHDQYWHNSLNQIYVQTMALKSPSARNRSYPRSNLIKDIAAIVEERVN